MKRFIYILLSVVFFAVSAFGSVIAESTPEPTLEPPPAAPDPFEDITTPYLLLMEANSGAVLYARNADEMAYPASTTKLMTALLAIENIADMNRVVTVGWRAVSGFGSRSSLMGLEATEEIALIDALHGLMMRSGNDAAKLLAIETVAEVHGDAVAPEDALDTFIQMMNDKAEEYGMTSTQFATVDGRHDDNHYTTASDFGILMQKALQNPLLCEVMNRVTYDIAPNNMHPQGYHLENSNKLICMKETDTESFLYPYCIGGKTGETNQAGFCLASAAEKDGVRLILIQFGDNNTTIRSTYRYETAKRLYNWGFNNYTTRPFSSFGLTTQFEVQTSSYSPYDSDYGMLTVNADLEGASVSGTVEYLNSIAEDPSRVHTVVDAANIIAPVYKGDIVGTVSYFFYENSAITVNLIASRDIASASQTTPEPHETAFITVTPPPSGGKNCNLGLQRSPGGNEFSVWVYHDGYMFTMNSTQWHYLYCVDGVFRAASIADYATKIQLYRQLFDSNGVPYYSLDEGPVDGGIYIIVADGYAVSSNKGDGTLTAQAIEIDRNGMITSGTDESILWRFDVESNGYRISNNSRYLVRKAGSGILFWILVVVIVLVIIIVVRLLTQRRIGGRTIRRKRIQRRSRR